MTAKEGKDAEAIIRKGAKYFFVGKWRLVMKEAKIPGDMFDPEEEVIVAIIPKSAAREVEEGKKCLSS